MRNYVKIEKKSLLYNYYAYIVRSIFLQTVSLFKRNLECSLGKPGRKQDSQYVVVLCKVWKWDAEKFVRAMEIFYNKLLLLGHGESVNFFEELGMRE